MDGSTPPSSTKHPVVQKLLQVDWENPSEDDLIALRSVIASTTQHAEAGPWVERILRRFHGELHEPQLAKDVDPLVRGPYGVVQIDLKESARPLARKPFRMHPEREDALKEFVDKYLERGWIRPSRSEWAAQAFMVPKPPTPEGKKQWRMVVDYRYLNTQTKDDAFPLPLIENLIGKQVEHRLWSIF